VSAIKFTLIAEPPPEIMSEATATQETKIERSDRNAGNQTSLVD
jgi:hypothetical protein